MNRRHLAVGLCLAVALSVSGCGSGTDTKIDQIGATSSTAVATSSTTAAVTDAPLVGAATTATSVPAQSGGPALLTAVRTSPHGHYDRLVFEFEGPTPGYAVEYVTEPFTNADTGAPIAVDGSSLLRVRLNTASTVNLSGAGVGKTYTGSRRLKPADIPVISEVVLIQDFEGILTWGVGLRREAPFKVETLSSPSRVVIDFAAS